ncbi:hypothetical protein F511_17716 [Dorcoceras hygrometricum]|uniref:Uncharacterized protein n=1 Tax=Dorcoceras hygrometricum TaxID=472368 RepID=A0A2Z7BU62_9LAMI|nr:hypothetical protein F511_17716 [Dorcoceras hygrometricum]
MSIRSYTTREGYSHYRWETRHGGDGNGGRAHSLDREKFGRIQAHDRNRGRLDPIPHILGRKEDTSGPINKPNPAQPYNRQAVGSASSNGSWGDRAGTGRGSGNRFREGRIYSHQKYLARKEKGLCYKCGEPYNPLHRCANKSLRVAFLIEDEEVGETEELRAQETEGENEDPTPEICEYNTLELPLFSMGGISHPQTMKFLGSIEGREVVVMIDSGASHNFVSRKLVHELGLQVDENVKFGVCLGDGGRVQRQGLCKGLVVDLRHCVIEVDGYVFQLGGVDLILGVEWLRTLGEVITNWELMRMSFSVGKRIVTLVGEPKLSRAVISMRSLLKVTDTEFCGALWCAGEKSVAEETREDNQSSCRIGSTPAQICRVVRYTADVTSDPCTRPRHHTERGTGSSAGPALQICTPPERRN